MKVIKSHRGDNRTPIMKSLYQIIESKKPNENIKGYKEARENIIFLDDSLMEKWDIKYPYILPATGAYYSTYYRKSFEFLDISGVFPVRVSYEDLNDYRVRGLRYNIVMDSFFKDEVNIQKHKDLGDGSFRSRLMNLEEFQCQFMTGTEPFQSFYKSNIRSKFHRKDGPLGYLYLTVEDVVKLFSLTGEGFTGGTGFTLSKGWENITEHHHESCLICDDEDDIGCECNGGEIPCEECEEGSIECDECGGSGYGTCDYCEGDATVRCNYCGGNGKGGEYGTCDECEGEGEIQEECSACDDGKGKIECKVCDGIGKDDRGEECGECDGDGEIECSVCDGEGEITESCENCDGSGEDWCSNCDSQGEVECDDCGGEGEVEGGCEYCDYGNVDCDECGGSGEQECPLCEGREYISCIFDDNISVYENMDEGLIKEVSSEPFSAYFDWKLNKGNVDARNGVYWVVEKIDFQNWLEADKEELQNILSAWTNDNLYSIDSIKSSFDKISNFSVTYTLATPEGSIGKVIRIHFVFVDGVFKVISVDGKPTSRAFGTNKMEYKGVIYYSLEDFRFLNWNTIDFNKLKS